MGHPLIDRLTTELGWPSLTTEKDTREWLGREGVHALFLTGDPLRNLETADVAVILPELARAFEGRFDCAVVAEAMEASVKEGSGVFKTPSIIFYRDGDCLGGISKVRDWDDYKARVSRFLAAPVAAE